VSALTTAMDDMEQHVPRNAFAGNKRVHDQSTFFTICVVCPSDFVPAPHMVQQFAAKNHKQR